MRPVSGVRGAWRVGARGFQGPRPRRTRFPCAGEVEEATETLRFREVEIVMEHTSSGSCTMSWVRDPWGNLFCIHRWNDGSVG